MNKMKCSGKQIIQIKCIGVCVSDGDSAQDVSDFNWDDYLEETGALSVPHHAFKHVGSKKSRYS